MLNISIITKFFFFFLLCGISHNLGYARNISFIPEDVTRWSAENQKNKHLSTITADHESNPHLDNFINEALKFRIKAINNPSETTEEMVEQGITVFSHIQNNELYQRYASTLAYFFAGSHIFVGNTLSDQPISTFYNPYLDIAMITYWQYDASKTGNLHLIDAQFVEGHYIHGLNESGPAWLEHTDFSRLLMLNSQYQKFSSAIEKKFPPLSQQRIKVKNITNQQKISDYLMQSSLISLLSHDALKANNNKSEESLKQHVESVLAAFRKQNKTILDVILPSNNILKAEHFMMLPQEVASGYQVYHVQWTPDENKALIFLVNPNHPRIFGALEYFYGSEIDLISFTLFDHARNYFESTH